jgi:DNA excision repair protein ERCC-3
MMIEPQNLGMNQNGVQGDLTKRFMSYQDEFKVFFDVEQADDDDEGEGN